MIDLGAALLVALLAGDAATDNFASEISGLVGANAGAVYTGFASGIQFATEPQASDAITSFVAARDAALARAATTELLGPLGGLTLTPGVYHSTAALGLTGILVLDALDDPNAVFIIQAPDAAITTAALSSVVLLNGANAARVFWVTGFALTLGAGSQFAGTALVGAAATLGAGATVLGRVLASAAVTLDANTITIPA